MNRSAHDVRKDWPGDEQIVSRNTHARAQQLDVVAFLRLPSSSQEYPCSKTTTLDHKIPIRCLNRFGARPEFWLLSPISSSKRRFGILQSPRRMSQLMLLQPAKFSVVPTNQALFRGECLPLM
jgi:hypothetical protein